MCLSLGFNKFESYLNKYMAYYEDLTPYNFHHYSEKELNVGWLQKGQPFNIGEVPSGFLDNIKHYAEKPFTIFHTNSPHICEFCNEVEGNCELRIVGPGSSTSQDVLDNVVYACPELIIHYIERHNYLPPQEFIEAVMNNRINMVFPGQDKYTAVVYKQSPIFWEQRKPDINDEDYEDNLKNILYNKLCQEVNVKMADDIMQSNSDFKKFIEAYNKVMPSIYGFKQKS